MQDIMNAKAQGAELILSGKLAGKGGRKRRVRIAQGYIKKVGNQVNLVDFAKANAYPKPGAIGIKLRIIHPGVEFPDKTDIRKFIEKEKEAAVPETGQAAEKEVSALEVETAKKEISEAKEKAEAFVETAKPVSKTAKKRTAKKAKEKKAVEKEEGKKSKEHENKKKAKAAE